MKIYLASLLQPENFGPGRLVGIVNGPKPRNIKIDLQFKYFTPDLDLIEAYNKNKLVDQAKAGQDFTNGYISQLEDFFQKTEKAAKQSGKNIVDILPFKDGDTLVSWERNNRTNYRTLLAPILQKMGFDPILN